VGKLLGRVQQHPPELHAEMGIQHTQVEDARHRRLLMELDRDLYGKHTDHRFVVDRHENRFRIIGVDAADLAANMLRRAWMLQLLQQQRDRFGII
jgi:hypothetical protein